MAAQAEVAMEGEFNARRIVAGSWRLVTPAVAAALVLARSAGAALVARADTPRRITPA